MPNRIIKESICISESVDALSLEAERLFYRLLVNCDDYGTFDARIPIIKNRCFPLKSDDIIDDQMIAWLSELESQEIIFFYEYSCKKYLKFTHWESHQQIRAKRRKNPDPDDQNSNRISLDIICNHQKSDAPVIQSNPIQSESNPNPIRNPNHCAVSVPDPAPTEENNFDIFWDAYPKKVGKALAKKSFSKAKVPIEKILQAIESQKKSKQWISENGRFIPNPATWLNQGRWDDEVSESTEQDTLPCKPDESMRRYVRDLQKRSGEDG